MSSLGIKLSDRVDSNEEFSLMVEVTVATLLVICLFLILGWIVCRMARGLRICCIRSVSDPRDALREACRRSRIYGVQQQV